MKIGLLSPYPDLCSLGLRLLSSCLKREGYQTRLVFLPDPAGDHVPHGEPRYSETILQDALSLLKDVDLVGMTVMTPYFEGAAQIASHLRKTYDGPVLWGGIHPTIRPEESLEWADWVCIGEGEGALLEVAAKLREGAFPEKVLNIWRKDGGKIIKEPLRPLIEDLDSLPHPDYSMEDHYVAVEDRLVELTHDRMAEILGRATVSHQLGRIGYQTMTSRGCPHKCTYCVNDGIHRLYGAGKTLRFRSVDHVMEELLWVKEQMPYVNFFWFSDDDFTARRMGDLEYFCERYRSEVGLPFSCLISPLSTTQEKMALLVDAGLVYIQMGVESASPRMQAIFNRKAMTNERILRAMHIVNQFRDRMASPTYDFLIDVPKQRDEDLVESLRFISRMPKPYRVQAFALIPYPGTGMYDLALEEGMIDDERRDIYNRTWPMHRKTYLNFLMILTRGGRMPGWLLRMLIADPLVRFLGKESLQPAVGRVYETMQRTLRRVKAVVGKR